MRRTERTEHKVYGVHARARNGDNSPFRPLRPPAHRRRGANSATLDLMARGGSRGSGAIALGWLVKQGSIAANVWTYLSTVREMAGRCALIRTGTTPVDKAFDEAADRQYSIKRSGGLRRAKIVENGLVTSAGAFAG